MCTKCFAIAILLHSKTNSEVLVDLHFIFMNEINEIVVATTGIRNEIKT